MNVSEQNPEDIGDNVPEEPTLVLANANVDSGEVQDCTEYWEDYGDTEQNGGEEYGDADAILENVEYDEVQDSAELQGAGWEEVVDEEGYVYYYNPATQESVWEAPDNYVPYTGDVT